MKRCTTTRPEHGVLAFGLAIWLVAGCAGPKLFPPAPLATLKLAEGGVERRYDADRDGRADHCERLSDTGRVTLLRFDLDGDEAFELEIDRDAIPPDDCRHLVILLDSIPFALVRDLWEHGRFRLFHPPSRVISPFPVITDPCFAEFLGVSPCRAVQARHFDGKRLKGGFGDYVSKVNSPWLEHVDYYLRYTAHGLAYLQPDAWFDHELRRIEQRFCPRDEELFVAYSVGASALGAQLGRNGHLAGLIRLDRFCQSIVHRTRGRVQITLLSDHGHVYGTSRSVSLRRVLARCGYRVASSLREPRDVVVPTFGLVTCAELHTAAPAAVARDIVGAAGIDLTSHLDGTGDVIVLNRNGRARISHTSAGYRYAPQYGDPLGLKSVLKGLAERGAVDADGFVADHVLFAATADHEYPDAVHRLWRAFHGLVEHTPDVLVSVKDGWICGSTFMSAMIDLAAAHGNLNRTSSTAFVMTTAGALPPVLRMEDLGAALRDVGVPVRAEPPDLARNRSVRPLAPSAGNGVVEQRVETLARQ